MLTIRERYETDAHFRTLVDHLHAAILQAEFTPTEIRQAAMLAQIMYEERRPGRYVFNLEDVKDGRV